LVEQRRRGERLIGTDRLVRGQRAGGVTLLRADQTEVVERNGVTRLFGQYLFVRLLGPAPVAVEVEQGRSPQQGGPVVVGSGSAALTRSPRGDRMGSGAGAHGDLRVR